MKNALLLPGQLPRLTWLHLTSFDYIAPALPPLPSSLTTSRYSSSLLFLLPIVALAFGRRVFCFPFTSSNWIKLPRFRRALCFCCSASQVFSAGKRSFRYAIFLPSLSLSFSLSRSLCYVSLPFTNSQLRTMLSRKEKIIGHKKCHSNAKEKKK